MLCDFGGSRSLALTLQSFPRFFPRDIGPPQRVIMLKCQDFCMPPVDFAWVVSTCPNMPEHVVLCPCDTRTTQPCCLYGCPVNVVVITPDWYARVVEGRGFKPRSGHYKFFFLSLFELKVLQSLDST